MVELKIKTKDHYDEIKELLNMNSNSFKDEESIVIISFYTWHLTNEKKLILILKSSKVNQKVYNFSVRIISILLGNLIELFVTLDIKITLYLAL